MNSQIEPVSGTPHIKIPLLERFINRHDCRSTTGRNLRKIMHYCAKIQISEITSKEIPEKSYHPTPVPEIWRLDLVKELLEIRDNNCDRQENR